MARAEPRPIYHALEQMLQAHPLAAHNPGLSSKQLLTPLVEVLEAIEQEKTDEWLKHGKKLGRTAPQLRGDRQKSLLEAAEKYAHNIHNYLLHEADMELMQLTVTEQWVAFLHAAIDEDQLAILPKFLLNKALEMLEDTLQSEAEAEIQEIERQQEFVSTFPLIRQLVHDQVYARYYGPLGPDFAAFEEVITQLMTKRHAVANELVSYACHQSKDTVFAHIFNAALMHDVFAKNFPSKSLMSPDFKLPTPLWDLDAQTDFGEKAWDLLSDDATDGNLQDSLEIAMLPTPFEEIAAVEEPEPAIIDSDTQEQEFFAYANARVAELALHYAGLRAQPPLINQWQIIGVMLGLFLGAVAHMLGMILGSVVGMYLGEMAAENQHNEEVDKAEAAAMKQLKLELLEEYARLFPDAKQETNLQSGDGANQLPQANQALTTQGQAVDETRIATKEEVASTAKDPNIVLSYSQDQIGLAIDSNGWYLTTTQPGLDDLVQKIGQGEQNELIAKYGVEGSRFTLDSNNRFILPLREDVVTAIMQQLDRSYPLSPIKTEENIAPEKEINQEQNFSKKLRKKGV